MVVSNWHEIDKSHIDALKFKEQLTEPHLEQMVCEYEN